MAALEKSPENSKDALDRIGENEIIESLKRSGYLLENRILSKFLKLKYSAEANHVIFSEIDGTRYREIDVVASKFVESIPINEIDGISVYSHFLIECINNTQPLGLFENLGDRDEPASDWIYTIINGDAEIKEMISIIFPSAIYNYEEKNIKGIPAKQYCSFAKKKADHKKDQWMAYHPDDFHKTLSKLADSVKYKVKEINDRWEDRQPQMLRIDIFIPVIILQNDLIKISQKSELELDIQNIKFHRLKTPYDEAYNRNLSIDIVQEKYFDNYLDSKVKGLVEIFNLLKDRISNYA